MVNVNATFLTFACLICQFDYRFPLIAGNFVEIEERFKVLLTDGGGAVLKLDDPGSGLVQRESGSLLRLTGPVSQPAQRKSQLSLFQDCGVSVDTWVEMTAQVPMRYETDAHNDHATLFFGQHNDYVLMLNRDNLARIISLGTQAIAELEKKSEETI